MTLVLRYGSKSVLIVLVFTSTNSGQLPESTLCVTAKQAAASEQHWACSAHTPQQATAPWQRWPPTPPTHQALHPYSHTHSPHPTFLRQGLAMQPQQAGNSLCTPGCPQTHSPMSFSIFFFKATSNQCCCLLFLLTEPGIQSRASWVLGKPSTAELRPPHASPIQKLQQVSLLIHSIYISTEAVTITSNNYKNRLPYPLNTT